MLRLMGKIAALVLVFCTAGVALSTAQSPASTPTPEMAALVDAQRALIDSINTPGGDGRLEPLAQRQMRQRVTEGWQLAGQWSAAWLNRHAEASAEDLKNILVGFTPPPHDPEVYDDKLPDRYAMSGFAVRIAPDVYVVAATYEESQSANGASTFFVVARDTNSRFNAKWSVKPIAHRHKRRRDEIGRWAFLGSCGYYCGPLVVQQVLPLPPARNGQPRFAIDAYQATNGSTLMKQLSAWQWNGIEAENLVARSYELYADEDRQIELARNLIVVPTKEPTSFFASLGCCAEPRGDWTLRITPDRVMDLGHRFLQPQIAWADRLLAATGRSSSPVGGLASPRVVAYLRHAQIDADSIGKCRVLSSGNRGAFEIALGTGEKIQFAYYLRNNRPYFTSVRVE